MGHKRRAGFAGLSLAVLVLLLPVVVTGCGSGGGKPGDMEVLVASYELVANQDNRFIAGLLTSGGVVDGDFISYGKVKMDFSYLGDGRVDNQPEFYSAAEGTFLPIPGEERADPPSRPIAGPASQGRGVYAVDPIDFDRPGFWQVDVTAKLGDGTTLEGVAAFQVYSTFQVPGVGQPALPSQNYTSASNVPPAAVDSRAAAGGPIPDLALHQWTIADALRTHKPIVLLFSTPVFCVSRFCGPITDMIAGLQGKYGTDAIFIHVEIWQDFAKRQATPTAIDWLYRQDDLREPWVFLIGRDGKIIRRWDNVVTRDEIVPALEAAIRQS